MTQRQSSWTAALTALLRRQHVLLVLVAVLSFLAMARDAVSTPLPAVEDARVIQPGPTIHPLPAVPQLEPAMAGNLLQLAPWLAKVNGHVTLSTLVGTALAYRRPPLPAVLAPDAPLPARRWENAGALAAPSLHYNFKGWWSAFAFYGPLAKHVSEVHQAAGAGVDLRDALHLTVFAGLDLTLTPTLGAQDAWFVGVGLAFEGLELDLGDLGLTDEELR